MKRLHHDNTLWNISGVFRCPQAASARFSFPLFCLKRLIFKSTSDGNKLFQREKGHMGVDRLLEIPLRRN